MGWGCCCTRQCAALSCGSGSVPRLPPSFVIWSRPISQRVEAGISLKHRCPWLRGATGDQFMPVHRSTLTRPLVAIVMVVASSLYAIAQQPPTPSLVRGTIEGVNGDELAVKSRGGEDIKLRMAGDLQVLGITRISLS